MASDSAVQQATGRGWHEWFGILDSANATTLPHESIARYLRDECNVTSWWAQSITVSYERERCLRVKHQARDGTFSANISKTVNAPLNRLFEIWNDAQLRGKWLDDPQLCISKSTLNKSIRFSREDDDTRVSVNFLSKSPAKAQVAVEHNKLPKAQLVIEMKAYWHDALERMKDLLENNKKS